MMTKEEVARKRAKIGAIVRASNAGDGAGASPKVGALAQRKYLEQGTHGQGGATPTKGGDSRSAGSKLYQMG